MKTRLALWLSLTASLALAVGIVLSLKHAPPPVQSAAAPQPVVATNVESQPPKVSSATPGSRFRWNQIESEDLKAYRDNLRAIGCPEVTVREIIRSVINERFGPRRQAILASFQGRFWQFLIQGEFGRRQGVVGTEWGQALEALRTERQKLITQVLGRDYLATEAELQARQESSEQKRSWLPADKRDRLSALEEQYQQHLAEWAESVGSRPGGAPTAEDNARMEALRRDFEGAQKQLLTPQELDELRLRESGAAGWASDLPGFEPTEDEWRTVAKLRLDYDQAQSDLAGANLTDEERQARQSELEAKLAGDTKGALGADRFAQYQLASDGQFQQVRDVTQRYGLSDQVAQQAYQIEQSALAQAKQVREDPNLSPDARQTALAGIQQETERTLNGTLGAKVFSTYKDSAGDWIKSLGQPQ